MLTYIETIYSTYISNLCCKDIAVSGEEQIAISRDAKHCIWKHAEAIGQGRMGQGELAKGFVVI